MKILQINKYLYSRGGAEQHMLDLTKLLEDHGDEVLHFSTKDVRNISNDYAEFFPDSVELSNINKLSLGEKIRFGAKIIYNRQAAKKLEEFLDRNSVDIAHIHNIYHHISPSILPVLKKRNIPVVMTIHDYKLLSPNYKLYYNGKIDMDDTRGWYLSCIKHRCIDGSLAKSTLLTAEMIFHHKIMQYYERYVDHFIAPSQFVKDIFVSCGWDKKKITVLHHFLPSSVTPIVSASSAPSSHQFVYVGRLSEEKGVKKLLQTWYDLRLPYKLDFFGSGPLEQVMKRFVQEKGLTQVTFHGKVQRTKLLNLLSNYTALIVPTLMYETFGLAVIEAFAKGLPAIVPTKGGAAELVRSSDGGVTFDWNKTNSFMNAIKQILDNDSYRVNALEYIKNHHVPDDYYTKIRSIYEKNN